MYTVRSGVEPGEVGFRLRFVGVDGVWKDFWNKYGAPSPSGALESPPSIRWPIFARSGS